VTVTIYLDEHMFFSHVTRNPNLTLKLDLNSRPKLKT